MKIKYRVMLPSKEEHWEPDGYDMKSYHTYTFRSGAYDVFDTQEEVIEFIKKSKDFKYCELMIMPVVEVDNLD
jgi:hypothetical protein